MNDFIGLSYLWGLPIDSCNDTVTIMQRHKFSPLTLALVLFSLAGTASAQLITNTPNANFVTNRSISMNGTSDLWSLNLSVNTGAGMELYALVGNAATAGTSDAGYYTNSSGGGITGLNGPQLVVGRNANGQTGTFAWKFVLDSGFTTTAGGSILANVGFSGTPSTQKANVFIGVSSNFVPSAGPSYSSYNSADFAKMNLTNTNAVFGSYTNLLSLGVPEGLSEFYVVLSDTGSSARFGLNSLDVTVNAIPEPSTAALLGLGAAGLIAWRWRRSRDKANR
jgi:hypothetical protein